MVDALRRAHRIVKPGGWVVDIHPTATHAAVEVADRRIGPVDAGDAPLRHTAAGVALAAAVEERLLAVDRTSDFIFHTYGDTIDELRDYIADNWRNARIDGDTVNRTRQALRAMPGAKPRVREHVAITRFRVLPVDRAVPVRES
jgi:hypothetical protein